VPGLGTSFGRGGATTFARDLAHADCILIMGSNMAECHPVAFRWVTAAQERGAVVIHADPRYTRTSALANIYVPLRAGSDIAFLGGLIRYVLEEQREFREYVRHYTNAAFLVSAEFQDTEDLDGVFSGLLPEGRYDPSTWSYERGPDGQPLSDPTLSSPRCVFQILKRHFARYTPEMVEQICGTPRELFLRVARTLCERSGPDRTSALCYAVGWTQHTTGVQVIRAAAILQLLLGNIGRPGGGILALRGHATIQGSTDLATLYHLHPGYLPAPSALRPHDTLADYLRSETQPDTYWSNLPKFFISQLRAWFGEAAREENEFGYQFLPKTIGDHSHLPLFVDMYEGGIKGFFVIGQNPAVGGQNARLQRLALARLDWLVVRDLFETETASFWKDSPEVREGLLKTQDIPTEVFLLPAAAAAEMEGSFTNTQRLVQWHDKAVDPPGDARSDLWFTVHLGLRLKRLYAGSREERDWPIAALTWDYIRPEENARWRIKDEPSATAVLREINGYYWADGRPLATFAELADDGSTACGGWVYTGIFAPDQDHPLGRNRARDRQPDGWLSSGWGFAWPSNRRILYNRASADPQGRPWPKEARLAAEQTRGAYQGYVYWDEAAGRWVGVDQPDFPLRKPPSAAARPDREGVDAHDGAAPFVLRPWGKASLFVPAGLADGPLPVHYEPYESPLPNLLYPHHPTNPVAKLWPLALNRYAEPLSKDYPHVVSTYRLTEHHLSGSMSRWLPWLAELQPELFCELSPEHAAELGIANTEWVEIVTPRGAIRAKALVTPRIRPFYVAGRMVHHVGLPWHWGYKGLTTGDVVNDLSALVGDPNVTIHEAKVFVCQVRAVRTSSQ
jgi:formate dehydrogenase major subunit